MTPREIVREALEQTIVPELEAYGFRYSTSQLKFSRKSSYATQKIVICLNRYNTASSIDFWTVWSTQSPEYVRWYKNHWNEKPESNGMGGCSDWNIPGWSYPKPGYHFDLSEPSRRATVMRALLENIRQHGLPYLESISTWEGAAEQLLKEGWMYGRAADFFLIAGMKEQAR